MMTMLGKSKYLGLKIPSNTSYCLHSADKYFIALCLVRKTEKGDLGKWQDTLTSNNNILGILQHSTFTNSYPVHQFIDMVTITE